VLKIKDAAAGLRKTYKRQQMSPLDILSRVPCGGFFIKEYYSRILNMQSIGMTDNAIIERIAAEIRQIKKDNPGWREKRATPDMDARRNEW